MTAGSSLVFLGLVLAGGAFGGTAALRRLGETGPSCALLGTTAAATLTFAVLAVLPSPPMPAGAMLPLPLRRQRRRKREPAPRSQDTQRLNTGGPLRLSRSIKKTELPADRVRQRGLCR